MSLLAQHVHAAGALSKGDPLAALNSIAADESAHGHALRGIALAQLQELDAAQKELRLAAEGFENEPLFRARALAALAEVAAARRELGTALESLSESAEELARIGDVRNATWVRLVRIRILLLIGSVEEAEADWEIVAQETGDDSVLLAALELARAQSALRKLSGADAFDALDRALSVLSQNEHPLLAGELDSHREVLSQPLARVRSATGEQELSLLGLSQTFRGGKPPQFLLGTAANSEYAEARRWLVVDGIAKRVLFCGEDSVDLSKRAVLFQLLEQLAAKWPGSVSNSELIDAVFDGPEPSETDSDLADSFRERCRVEMARLRDLLPAGATIEASGQAWRLVLPAGAPVLRIDLLRESSTLKAFLSDGHAWAARDLALAIGASPRSMQRALLKLAGSGAVQPTGEARARRWRIEGSAQGIASQMFLVSLLNPS